MTAGAFSNDDYAALEEKSGHRYFGRNRAVSTPSRFARKDLDPAVRNRLKEILLSMHQDDEGRKILRQTDNTTKFDLLPGGEVTVRRKLLNCSGLVNEAETSTPLMILFISRR